jgi:hypothetical protein
LKGLALKRSWPFLYSLLKAYRKGFMKFQCKHTGQVYEFLSEHDIEEMLKHDEYFVVEEEAPKPKQKKEPK